MPAPWRALGLLVVLILVGIAPIAEASTGVAGTSLQWTLSGASFGAGSFQNTTVGTNGTLQFAARLPPSNRTMVLDIGSPGAADSSYLTAPCVLRETNGTYEMWYTGVGSGGYNILLATSTDGVNWTKMGVVLAGVLTPSVIETGSVYHMWYTQPNSGSMGTDQIYHATSSNGISWTVQGLALGLGSPGSWDAYIVAYPWVMQDPSGLYRMYYTGWNSTGSIQIGVATSTDLLTWTRFPLNPVLTPGAAGSWDAHPTTHSIVVLGSQWIMYYEGTATGSYSQIGVAASIDGYNWTKNPANPTIPPEQPAVWDGFSVGTPDILLDPSGPRIYYNGGDGGPFRIGLYRFGPPPAVTYRGTYISIAFDSGTRGTSWIDIISNASVPAGTSLSMRVRAGNTSIPDSGWTPWISTTSADMLPRTRFVQLAADFVSSAWNLTPTVQTITVDYLLDRGPDVSPTAPPATDWTNNSRPLLRWNMSDPEGDAITSERVQLSRTPDFAVVTLDSGNLSSGTTAWQVPYLLMDGTWFWRVQAEDRYGVWSAWRSSELLVDTTSPVLAVTSPMPDAFQHTSSVSVVWTASDGLSGLDHVAVSLDGATPVALAASVSSLILNGVPDGIHQVRVTAFDRAGNAASVLLSFTVDTNVLDVNGPYGPAPLAALIFVVVAVSVVVVALWVRARGRTPPGHPPQDPRPPADPPHR